MRLRYYYDLLRGKTKAIKPATLSFSNIKAVVQAWWRAKKQKFSFGSFSLEKHIWEQIVWRRTQVVEKSPECWREGVCKVCGCEILGKTMEDRSCENNPQCYPQMFHVKRDWEKYKSLNNIKLFD